MSSWPLLGQLDPPTGWYDLPAPGPLLNPVTGIPEKGHNGEVLRDFPFLPREFSCSVMEMDPRDIEVYFRMHPKLSYKDLGSRQPSGCLELVYKLTDQLNNRRLRKARRPYNARVWRKNTGQPAKVLIEQVEKLTDNMLKKNCNWIITPRGIQDPDNLSIFLPLDYFLENGVEHTPHEDVLNAISESKRLKALAAGQGHGHWREIPMVASEDGKATKWLGRHVKGTKRKSQNPNESEAEHDDSVRTKPPVKRFQTSRGREGFRPNGGPTPMSAQGIIATNSSFDLSDAAYDNEDKEALTHSSGDRVSFSTAESTSYPEASVTKYDQHSHNFFPAASYFTRNNISHPISHPGYVSGGTIKGWGQKDIWRGRGGERLTRAPAFGRDKRRAELGFQSAGFLGGDQHRNSHPETSAGGIAATLAEGCETPEDEDLEEENLKKYSLLATAAAQAGASDEQVSQMWVTGRDLGGRVWKMTELSQLKSSRTRKEDRSLAIAPKAMGTHEPKLGVKAMNIKRDEMTKSYGKGDLSKGNASSHRESQHVSGAASRGKQSQGGNMSSAISSRSGFLSMLPNLPYCQQNQTRAAEKAASRPRKRSMAADDQHETKSRKRSRFDVSTPSSNFAHGSTDPPLFASPSMNPIVQASSAPGNGPINAVYPLYTKAGSECATASPAEKTQISSLSPSLAEYNASANWSLLDQRPYDPVLAAHPSTGTAAVSAFANEAFRIPYVDTESQTLDPYNRFGQLEPHIPSYTLQNNQSISAPDVSYDEPYYGPVNPNNNLPGELPSFLHAYTEVNPKTLFSFINPYLTSSNRKPALCLTFPPPRKYKLQSSRNIF